MFYTYSQNNSGGSFVINESVGQYVIIEADSPGEADRLAEEVGIYFNGCDRGEDCNCCGDRWYEQYSESADEEPMIYGKTIEEYKKDPGMIALRQEECIHIYYKDGRHEKVVFDAAAAIEKKRAAKRKAADKLWGNVFSFVSGVTNKNPIRLYRHESWDGKPAKEFYDKSGNRSMEEGLHINYEWGWLSFASPKKSEVIEFMEGAKEMLEEIREVVSGVAVTDDFKGMGAEAVAKLFLGKKG
jgi:hypothetical protein